MFTRRQWLIGAGVFVAAGIIGCERKETTGAAVTATPVALDTEAECAVCGMRVAGFPGPKAQLHLHIGNQSKTLFFCSTRDFFAFVRQPEQSGRDHPAFVHDMSSTPWDQADSAPWVDARQASYVPSRKLTGAMGPTFASFASREAATQWMQSQGENQVLLFSDVDLDAVSGVGQGQGAHHSH